MSAPHRYLVKMKYTNANCGEKVDLAEAKQSMLDMLQALADICEANGIRYYLDGGTLIGAARHKGFIPWDDDIDVFMERKYYEKFLRIYDGKYQLVTNKHPKWFDGYSRLTDETTVMEYDNGTRSFHGIWMAILPVDNFPSDEEWKSFEMRLNKNRSLGKLKQSRWNKKQSLISNLIKITTRFVLYPILKLKSTDLNKTLASYNNKQTSRKANISTWFMSKKPNHWPQVFDASCFDDYIRVEFEGCFVESMKYPEKYLESTYGDWRQLPPVEERVGLHNYTAYWID